MKTHLNIAGDRYGNLTVASYVETIRVQGAQWLCKCDCGGQRVVSAAHLRSGHIARCKGCVLRGTVNKTGRIHRTGNMRPIDPTPCPDCGMRGGHDVCPVLERRSVWQSGGTFHHAPVRAGRPGAP